MSELNAEAALDRAQVFWGEATPVETRVYVRLPGEIVRPHWRLSGTIAGPQCVYSQTLPFTVRMSEAGRLPELLAEARVPEPCFWTPDMPFTYDVTLDLMERGATIASQRRLLGIRRLATRGDRFVLDGEPWTLKAASATEVTSSSLMDWHRAGLACALDVPDDDVCREASRMGTLLVARIASLTGDPLDEMERLARWPAVGLIELDASFSAATALRRAAPNVLFAARSDPGGTQSVPDWADVVVSTPAGLDAIRGRADGLNKPMIRLLPIDPGRAPAEVAGDIDRLGGAKRPKYAGYLASG